MSLKYCASLQPHVAKDLLLRGNVFPVSHLVLLQTGYTEDWQCAIYECDLRGCVSGLSGSVPGVFLALLQHVNEAKISLFPNTVISSCLTFDRAFS